MSVRIHHGGREYVIVDRDVDELRAQIADGLASGQPYWLPVKFGEGRPSDGVLLITAGVDLALVAEEKPDQVSSDEVDEDEPLE
jgi:hypothetical protein